MDRWIQRRRGLYGAAIIENRCYWPHSIDGKKIKTHFISKVVGAVDALHGELDNIPLRVFAMKEEDYVMMPTSTYDTNYHMDEDKLRTIGGEITTLNYPETVHKILTHRCRGITKYKAPRTYLTGGYMVQKVLRKFRFYFFLDL